MGLYQTMPYAESLVFGLVQRLLSSAYEETVPRSPVKTFMP